MLRSTQRVTRKPLLQKEACLSEPHCGLQRSFSTLSSLSFTQDGSVLASTGGQQTSGLTASVLRLCAERILGDKRPACCPVLDLKRLKCVYKSPSCPSFSQERKDGLKLRALPPKKSFRGDHEGVLAGTVGKTIWLAWSNDGIVAATPINEMMGRHAVCSETHDFRSHGGSDLVWHEPMPGRSRLSMSLQVSSHQNGFTGPVRKSGMSVKLPYVHGGCRHTLRPRSAQSTELQACGLCGKQREPSLARAAQDHQADAACLQDLLCDYPGALNPAPWLKNGNSKRPPHE